MAVLNESEQITAAFLSLPPAASTMRRIPRKETQNCGDTARCGVCVRVCCVCVCHLAAQFFRPGLPMDFLAAVASIFLQGIFRELCIF